MFAKYTLHQFVTQSARQIQRELYLAGHITERTATILHEGAKYYTGRNFDYFQPVETLKALQAMIIKEEE